MLFHILDVLVRQKLIFFQEVEIDQNDEEKKIWKKHSNFLQNFKSL